MKNSKFKTIISILISVILIFCCVSVVSFAEESSTYPKGWLSGSGDKEWFTQEYYTDNWLYYREDEETSYPKGWLDGPEDKEWFSDSASAEDQLNSWRTEYINALKESGVGDISEDGKISSLDARKALRASAKLETLTDEQTVKADVLGFGEVNAADARRILRVSAKLDILPRVIKIKNGTSYTVSTTASYSGPYKMEVKTTGLLRVKSLSTLDVLKYKEKFHLFSGTPCIYEFTPPTAGRYIIWLNSVNELDSSVDYDWSYCIVLIAE